MQRYNIFVGQCISLAESLIFKSETIAEAMNVPLVEAGKIVPADKMKWRYYQHLAGQRFETDTPLMIMSLDTKEEIELTIENLARHKKTSNVYRSDSKYITELLVNNPKMNVYIRGVFWPVDMADAITAEDCTILYYDTTLVEPQEMNLIYELSDLIFRAHARYMADGWKVYNDLYVTAFYGVLYVNLPYFIETLRNQRVHTVEVHSFHVAEFLASHQKLNEFIPYMTEEQKFSIYRNIRYWERHAGKEDVLNWLIDVFLTGWNMPVVAYNLGQEIHNPAEGELLPHPIAYREALNFNEDIGGRDLIVTTTSEVINKEYGLAYDNANYAADAQEDLDNRLSLTQYPAQTTKLLEITAIDPETIERDQLDYTLFNELLHLACLDRYNIFHDIINPTNGDTIRLSTKELIAMFLYAAYRGYSGIELKHIPTMNCQGVLLKRWVTYDELEKFLPDAYANRWAPTINYYIDTHDEVYNNILNSDEFFGIASTILANKRRRWRYTNNRRTDPDTQAGLQLFEYYYRSYVCDLKLPYEDYVEFFRKFGMDYEIISNEAWADIAVDSFNILTAFDTNSSVTQSEIQRMMVRLMTMLSSYTIHFATTMASDRMIVTDPLMVRVDSMLTSASISEIIISDNMGWVSTKTDSKATAITPDVIVDILDVKTNPNPPVTPSKPDELGGFDWFDVTMDVSLGIQIEINAEIEVLIDQPSVDVCEVIKN